MEDGIERMMSPELYNIHFLNDKINKNEKMKKNIVKDSKESTTVVKDSSTVVKDLKEEFTNPQ